MPELTSTLTIVDKSSSVLDAIAKAAEKTSTQIEKLIGNLDKIGAIHLGIDQTSFDNTISAIETVENSISKLCDSKHDISFDVHKPNLPDDVNKDQQKEREKVFQDNTQNGIGSIIDIGNKLYGTFGLVVGAIDTITNMMRRVDKSTQQTARFEQLAKGEGFTGQDVMLRGKQMRKVAFERAQELGVDVTTFNDQLMSFANNSAFSSFEEATEFATSLNKMFIASGTSADAASGAITQLLQGLSKGKLQGEDLMSILSNAPEVGGLLEKAYARMNNIPVDKLVGKVRDLAGEGKLTGDVIKEAILGSSEDIEAKFKAMPMSFETAMTRIKNSLDEMLQPLFKQFTEFANSDEFKVFMDSFMKISQSIAKIIIPAISYIIKNVSPILAKAAEVLPYIVDSFISIVEKAKYILIGIGACIAATWAWNAAVGAVKAVLTAISAHPIIAIAVGTAMIIGFILKMQEESEKFYEICTKIGIGISMIGDLVVTSMVSTGAFIVNSVVKLGKFITGLFSSIIGNVINGVVSGWNWLMDKIGASDLVISSNIGQDIVDFGKEQLEGSSFSAEGVFDTDGLRIEDAINRIKNAWGDFDKTGRELGWKGPKGENSEDDEFLELMKKLERESAKNTKNTGNIDKNTRSVSIDRDSILFMKSMTTAEVINRYNNIHDSIAINNHYGSMPSKQRAERNLQAQLQGAQNALRGGA